MTFDYQGNPTDFRDIFYLYCVGAEGYELKVYPDIYGNPTVGLGHLVQPSDNLSIGDVITQEQVLQFFYDDYARLNIDQYVSEAAQNYNQALAIAHFVWSHGDGQYKNSTFRQDLINHSIGSYCCMVCYISTGWDTSKPANQKVDDADFAIYYSDVPWTPSKDLTYYYNQIAQFVSNSAATEPILTYGLSAGLLLMAAGFVTWAIVRIKNKGKK